MTVFEWIEMAKDLPAEGLEMYDGFFLSTDKSYLLQIKEAIYAAGFVMPMLCCSPDFTNPDKAGRQASVERQIEMIRACHLLGGEGSVCRVLSGQRYPDVDQAQGIE